jgi:L-iditol 2-dehydrogenase
MRAVQKWGLGQENMGLRDVPEPQVGPNDLLVEVGAVGICGSDIHLWKDEHEHRIPVIPGHEYSGVVIGKGSNIGDAWQPSGWRSRRAWPTTSPIMPPSPRGPWWRWSPA